MVGEARLVTLIGPGGAGKTRLTLQVAGEVADNYRDGVWLVELAPLGEGSMVLPAIANVFGLQPDARRSLEVVLADFLRDKEMLLVLDNCEHLIEVCAALATELLDGAAGLTILASSREALGVAGESILRVPSLSCPAIGDETAATLKHFEAVQLFSERAHAVSQEFQITDENAVAVADICRRLDGIPLAIELATSRLRLFSPQQLASRLTDRFRLLTGGSRTAMPRQQTLQALIDWSYELLSPEEQALFRRLSVFVGGWTFEAAEVVGNGLDVLELLDQLVNKSLVQTEQTAAGTRFRYLETIRQYARERLFATGEGESVRDLHFAFFADLAADEIKKFDGPRRDEVRPKLKPEIDNFRQALEWALERDTVAMLDMLFSVLTFMVQATGWGDQYAIIGRKDVQRWLAIAAQSLGAVGPDEPDKVRRSRAVMYLIAGQMAMGSGAFDLTRQETSKAIALARDLDDQSLLMAALGFFAVTANAQQTYDQEAVKAAEECLALARMLGSSLYKSMSLNLLASYEMLQGNVVTAQAYRAEAAKGGGFMSAMAALQSSIDLADMEGDTTKALHYLLESRRLFAATENAQFIAISTSQIAHIRRRGGDLDAAEADYRESLSLFHWQGHTPAVAHELECLAFIARRRNMPERAASLLGAAEALRAGIDVPMLTNEQAEYDQELAALRDTLDPEVFQAAWFTGRAMEINQAVQYALAYPSSPASSPDDGSS
jgi:predicted ATPase